MEVSMQYEVPWSSLAMKGISTSSQCLSPLQYPLFPSPCQKQIINNTEINDVFPFPASLSVSAGVMLTPVAQDLAFLMTPRYQVFFHYFYFKNNFSFPWLFQTLLFFCCEGHFKSPFASYATLFSTYLSNRNNFWHAPHLRNY